ncbi:hypothetical protein GF343_00215 [Candidatus Woesearchaeota archaeon]|nr:hypothetical protein [Candidatus Woesearchaeota archaeon]
MNDFILPAQKQIESLEYAMRSAADALQSNDNPVAIVHHNDTDGLSAGAIISEALKRTGREARHYCMEQIYSAPLAAIYDNHSGPVIIVDLGVSKSHKDIIFHKTRGRPTILIDHHETDSETLPIGHSDFFDINCTTYKIDGDNYASASTVAYLFASKLCDVNDLAHLAVLGAAGDKNNTEKGRFPSEGLDKMVEDKAQSVRFEDVYQIRLAQEEPFQVMDEIINATMLLGSVGYRKQFEAETGEALTGPCLGMRILITGYDENTREIVKNLEKTKEKAYADLVQHLLEKKYTELDNLIFFDASDFFRGMGVKTVGNFCNHLTAPSRQQEFPFIRPNMYVMGAQLIEPITLGDTAIDAFSVPDVLKVSIRTHKELEARIEASQNFSVYTLLKMANPKLFASSHKLRGSTIVNRNKLLEFLENCNSVINTGESRPLQLPPELEFSAEG